MMSHIRRYFISGLLVWLPIWVTILVIKFIIDILNNTLSLLPRQYQPDALLGFHFPGMGMVITLLIIFITGAIAANFLGRRLGLLWDRIVARIPIVRSVYTAVRKVVETVFKSNGQSFRKVFLVEYPRVGLWSIAFQTGDAAREVQDLVNSQNMIALFVPTTPNPTSGFLFMVPRDKAMELSMSVDQALKYVISLGVMHPEKLLNKG